MEDKIKTLVNNYAGDFIYQIECLRKLMEEVSLGSVILSADVPLGIEHNRNFDGHFSLRVGDKALTLLNGHGGIENYHIDDLPQLLKTSNWFYAYVYIGEMVNETHRIDKQFEDSLRLHEEINKKLT